MPRPIADDEHSAGREILGLDEPRLEDAGSHVYTAHGARVGFGELASQAHEAADMVPMVVRQHHVLDIRELDCQFQG